MSRLSGKCDLFDHISFEKMVPDKDNPNILRSDIMECFKIFKERTKGVIYQHKHLKVSENNQDLIEKLSEGNFKVITHKEEVQDLRRKDKTRTKVTYTYMYWDKEYTLKEINKHGVFVKVPIRFNTLIDLIPYLPYLVSMSANNQEGEIVYITNKSYVDQEFEEMLEHGCDMTNMRNHYKKELSELYRDVILKYYNPQGREHEELVEFDKDTLQGKLSKPIDDSFDLKWVFKDVENTSHWCSPKIVDAPQGIIEINKYDLEKFGNKMWVYYVEYKDFEPSYKY